MLHDPYMECTCDGEGCKESLKIMIRYDDNCAHLSIDADISEQLWSEGWWTLGRKKHYCPECAEKKENQNA